MTWVDTPPAILREGFKERPYIEAFHSRRLAAFLRGPDMTNAGACDGPILSVPNFGSEE